jgi:hypothetical protein
MAAEPKRTETSRAARGQRALLLLASLGAAAWAAWPQPTPWHAVALALLAAAWVAYALVIRRRARSGSGEEITVPALVSRTDVIAAGDRLLARTRQKGQPLCVALVEVADITDVERLFGQPVAEGIMARLAQKLRVLATARGVAARTGQTQFSLLLPGRGAEEALLALRAALGEAGCIEDDARDELLLLPDMKLEVVGPEHASIEPVYDSLVLAMLRIHRARLFAPTAPTSAAEQRAAMLQAQERRASLYAPTLPMTP